LKRLPSPEGESSYKFFVEQPQVGLVGFDISYVALNFSSSAENVPDVSSLDFWFHVI